MKHTPRPWSIIKCNCNSPVCNTYQIKEVGTFYQGCGFKKEDASLIAAAPDLLAACEEALVVIKEWGKDEFNTEEGMPTTDSLKTAIAKARGEK